MNIIITGASKGLGKAMAKKFAVDGNTLFLCARNEDQLNATANEIQNESPNSIIYTKKVDVSKKNEVIEFGNFCLQKGSPDILINNAGQFIQGSVYNEIDGALEQMITTNLYSAYYLSRAIIPAMMETKKGHIFNICSIASLQAYQHGGSYSISKFAMLGFSKNLRDELKPHNIKVTSVLPGAAYTDSWIGSGVDEKRIMEANDIAIMVYAASQLSAQACVEEILLRPQLGDL